MRYEVTIGIPVYRAAGYIEHTMESALNQTFSDIEYLVVDDCGEDGSILVVEKLRLNHPRGKDIRILYNDQNCGVGATRNRIIDEAQGRYLFFLDSDDLIEPETIQILVNKVKEYKPDVVYGSLDRIDLVNDSPTKSYILPDQSLLSNGEMANYAFQNYDGFQISVCNCLMNLYFLRSNQLRFIDTQFWEDLAFTYEMVTKVNRAVLVSDITYHYLCRPGSLSHYQDREQLDKAEILNNVSTMDYLKEMCLALKSRPYLPYLCKNLEMNSFYIICHLLKNKHRIKPEFTIHEIQGIMRHPMSLREILKFSHLLLPNLVLWLLGRMPVFFFIPSIWMIGKLKTYYLFFRKLSSASS
jgi:glycosyltransferase involved in cell wall biosynthesis